jgi:geranylgeranyl diphosphate synthase type II
VLDFDKQYSEYKNDFEKKLAQFCDNLDCKPQILAESLKYSLNIGGKRIRPVLMYAVADLLDIKRAKVENFALALELIHTYSLIHDDLPEMDNDDFRRGKPSNHKKFGTGNAVLAGDGLMNTAYSILFGECLKGEGYIKAAKYICDCAGIYGMIAGQSADLLYEKDENATKQTLDFIYEHKTAKLIMAAVSTPALISNSEYLNDITSYGKDLGYLFQLTDDILDVEGSFDKLGKTIGKDSEEGKLTSVKLYGLEESNSRADRIYESCLSCLNKIDGDTSFLKQVVEFVRKRAF